MDVTAKLVANGYTAEMIKEACGKRRARRDAGGSVERGGMQWEA